MSNETFANKQRVAIVGAGPAGFYAAAALLRADDVEFSIDFIDKLCAPFGLLRYGVAPDHQKIKRVRVVFEKTLHHERVRFFGGVELGRDVTRDELLSSYDRVIYATGSQGDRKLGIPGEDLPGVYSATEFVAWYNGHPEFADLDPKLDVSHAVIVGAGNVALDVARLMAKSHEELSRTDIADHALAHFAGNEVTDISIIARRGPADAKFSNPELKEFGELANATSSVRLNDFTIDDITQQELADDRLRRRNVEILREFHQPTGQKNRQVHFRFLESPVSIIGDAQGVTHVEVVKNRLERSETGRVRPVATHEKELIPAGLVIRSIGYLGTAIPGLPFDQRRGVMPSEDGRLLSEPDGITTPNEYVVGWAKRGPSGVIGTNKPDAEETAEAIIADAQKTPRAFAATGIHHVLEGRSFKWISSDRWRELDAEEQRRGQISGRPRVKFVHHDEYHGS